MTNKLLKSLLYLLVILIVVGGLYLWYRGYILPPDTSYPAIKQRLERFMDIPPEEPAVVSVVDADRLKKQDTFYRNTQNGDMIIIWKEKALIYRPQTHKVIDWGITIK